MQKKNYYLDSVLDLNSSNVWGVDGQELLDLWQKDIKDEDFASSEEKVLNVVRLAFDVYHFDPKDEREVKRYSTGEYVILPGTSKHKDAIAIRKKVIRQITDLSYENVKHITAAQLLSLIEDTLMSDNPRIWYYALMDYGAELKKKVQNPNRKSAHYTKQSRFEGSLRQARGAVLRQLVREKHGAAVTLESISQTENIDYDRIKAAAEALLAENMIISAGGGYVIRD